MSKVFLSDRRLFFWLIVSGFVAIAISISKENCDIWGAVLGFISNLVPSVRRASEMERSGAIYLAYHYAAMWSAFPAIMVSLFLGNRQDWNSVFGNSEDHARELVKWIFLTSSFLVFIFFPIWDAGPALLLGSSIFTFAPLSIFIVYFCALYLRVAIFKVLRF